MAFIQQWAVQTDAQLRKTTLKLVRKPVTVFVFVLLCSLGVIFAWLPSLISLGDSSSISINEKAVCGVMDLDNKWRNQDCTLLAYSPSNPTTNAIIDRMRSKFNYQSDEIKGYDSIDEIARAVFKNTGKFLFVANFVNTDPTDFQINLYANLTINSLTYDEYTASYEKPNQNLIKLQHQLDSSVLEIINSSKDDEIDIDVDIEFQSFPFYQDISAIGDFLSLTFLPTSLSMGILMAAMIGMYLILNEKKDGILKMMRTMGLCESSFWFTWGIGFALLASIGAILPAFLGRLTDIVALEKIDIIIILIIFATFFWAVTMFNVMFVSFTNKVALIGMATLIIFGFVMLILDVINGTLLVNYLAGFELKGNGFKSFYLKLLYSPNTAMIWHVLSRASPVVAFAKVITNIVAVTSGAETRSNDGTMISQEYGWDQFTNKIGPYIHNDKEWWSPSDADTCLLMILEAIAYMIISWYMAQVFGGGNKKVYFFLQPSYWGLTSSKTHIASGDTVGHAKALSEKNHSIQLIKLSKGFKGIQAVKELSLNMKMGETFCLLGHNGAGKTTAINVLTGVYKPTFGNAFVLGHSVEDEIGTIQSLMGICPQHDILFDELSGADHIRFWARFKGLDRSKLNDEVLRALDSVDLYPDVKKAAGKYSGGMQRRLSVAIATLGSPKVIFLDEPTTGMDPLTRRKVWGTINELKKNAVVVLTTHNMEEADALGDHIAIMAEGSLKASGTSLFLKDKYGHGSQVNLITDLDNTEKIEQLAKHHVPAAKIVSCSAGNMTFSIPKVSRRRLPGFFEALEDSSNKVSEWGVSSTTLEEVFISLTKANRCKSSEGDIEDDIDEHKKCKICEIRSVARVKLLTGKGLSLFVDGVICKYCARTPEEVKADDEREAIEYNAQQIAKEKKLKEDIMKEISETYTQLKEMEADAIRKNRMKYDNVQKELYDMKKKIYDLQQEHGDYEAAIAQQRQEHEQEGSEQKHNVEAETFVNNLPMFTENDFKSEETQQAKPSNGNVAVGTKADIIFKPSFGKQVKALSMKNFFLLKRQEKTIACFLYCACQVITVLLWAASASTFMSFADDYTHSCDGFESEVSCDQLPQKLIDLSSYMTLKATDYDIKNVLQSNTEFSTNGLDIYTRDLWYSQVVNGDDTLVEDLMWYDSDFKTPFINFKNKQASDMTDLSTPVRIGQEKMISESFRINITDAETTLDAYFPLFAMFVNDLKTNDNQVKFDGQINDYAASMYKWGEFEVNFYDKDGKELGDYSYKMGTSKLLKTSQTMQTRMQTLQWIKYSLLRTIRQTTDKIVNMVKTTVFDFGDMIEFEHVPSVDSSICSAFILLGQFFIPHFVQQITLEKESNLLSALRMQGMKLGSYHLSNYLFIQLLVIMPTTFVLFSMVATNFEMGQPIFYWIVALPCWAHSSSGLAFLMPAFFRKSKIAIIVMFITIYLSSNVSSTLFTLTNSFPWWVAYIPFIQGAKLVQELLSVGTSIETIIETLTHMVISGTVLLFIGITIENIALGVWKPHQILSRMRTRSKMQKARKEKVLNCMNMNNDYQSIDDDTITIEVNSIGSEDEDVDVINEMRRADKLAIEDKPIIVRHLKKSFGDKKAVNDVSFVGDEGHCFGLLGPNGAGKTTTLSMMSGTLNIGSGSAIVSGYDVETELEKVYTVLGMSPQFDRLYEEMTVEEHLKVYSTLRGINPAGMIISCRGAAESVELDGDQYRMISRKLSGGMKRRLSLAIALCAMPKVVFLDEPTTGLDPQTRQQIWKIIHSLKKDRCLVLTTHSMEEADTLCDRIGIMAHGIMRCIGTNMHLKHKYGQGLHLKVNLRNNASDDKLVKYLHTLSEESEKVYSFGNSRTFMIPSEVKISKIYRELDHLAKSLDISEWAINQASLEEVFIHIARRSHDENDK